MIEWIGTFIEAVADFPFWAMAGFFFLAGFIEIIFPPWPGTTILVFGGCISGAGYPMGWLVIGIAFYLGESVGSILAYEFGRRRGRRILDWKVVKKVFTPTAEKKATNWMEKYGVGMLWIAKFTAGINSPCILLAGMMKMPRLKCYLSIALACFVHNCLFFIGGNMVGGNWEDVLVFVERNNRLTIQIAIGLAIVYVLYQVIRHYVINYRKKKNNGGEGDNEQ